MADYYTEFSFAINDLTEPEKAWAEQVKAFFAEHDYEGDPESLPPELGLLYTEDDFGMGFTMEVEDDDSLWIYSDESGDVDSASRFVQSFLRKFRPDDCEGFEWAGTCSKPRLDAFCGGAVFITATEIDATYSGKWLGERTAAHMAAKENA